MLYLSRKLGREATIDAKAISRGKLRSLLREFNLVNGRKRIAEGVALRHLRQAGKAKNRQKNVG